MFRESGCVGHLARLLAEIFPPETPEARFIAESREKAGWGLLQLLRLFLPHGESSTLQNQSAFFKAGTAQALLDMSFHPGLPVPVRVAALKTTADLISNNAPIQEQFAALQIAIPSESTDTNSQAGSQTNGSRSNTTSARNSARPSAEKTRTYVIEALLDLTLDQPRSEAPLRNAACALIQAYLGNHDRIRNHFLLRAVSGFEQGEEAANVLTALIRPGTDALGVLFASWIIQDLVADNHDAKKALAAVKEGNESEGEEVLTSLQAMGSQLEAAMQTGADERIILSYASTLTVILWEFADGVNDLLAEGSGLVQALVGSVSSAATAPTIAGLAASLLGTVYEFSTKDSPIPRRTLAPLLTQKLGRGKYLDALLALRRDPAIRDFGIEEMDSDPEFVNEAFVDLFQTEYPRLRKAIDKDPGVEVIPFADVEAGVDRDVLDDLRQQLQTVKDALSQSQQDAQQSSQQSEHDKLSLQKESQTANAELDRLRKINEAMQKGHEEETTKMQSQHQREKETLNVDHSRAIASARQEADRQARQTHEQQEQGFNARVQDYERKLTELGNAHRNEQNGHNNAKQQLDTIRKQHSELTTREQASSRQLQDMTSTHRDLERTHQQLQSRTDQAESDLEQARKQLTERDAELASLKSQLSDVQEDLKSKEQELASERSGFAELEKELQAAKAASEAKAAGDSETAAKLEKLESLSKNLTGKVKELQEEVKTAKASQEAAEQKLGESEKKSREALEKAKQAKEAAEKSVKDVEKKAKDAAEKSFKEAERKVQEAEKKAKEATEKAKKAAAADDNSGGAGGKKKGAQQQQQQQQQAASKKEAEEAAKSAEASKKELESAKEELEAAKKDVANAKEELETANKAAEAAKAAEKEAREELENMVLVIEDIEKKRDEYKGKVRELGGEVSEDDESEDDDEDDEDEDEE